MGIRHSPHEIHTVLEVLLDVKMEIVFKEVIGINHQELGVFETDYRRLASWILQQSDFLLNDKIESTVIKKKKAAEYLFSFKDNL